MVSLTVTLELRRIVEAQRAAGVGAGSGPSSIRRVLLGYVLKKLILLCCCMVTLRALAEQLVRLQRKKMGPQTAGLTLKLGA